MPKSSSSSPFAGVLFGICGAIGCGPTSPPSPSTVLLAMPPSERDDPDEVFAAIDRHLPGFGGAFLQDGALQIYWKQPISEEDPAARAAGAVLSEIFQLGPGGQGPPLRIRRGRYRFGELLLYKALAQRTFSTDHLISFVDIADEANLLRIGVGAEGCRASLAAALSRAGVPADAVQIVVRAPLMPTMELSAQARPFYDGMRIETPAFGGRITCSSGFAAHRYGQPGIVINAHCTRQFGGVVGGLSVIYQPSLDAAEANRIGVEVADPVPTTEECDGFYHRCRNSDSAFIKLDPMVTPPGGIAYPSSIGSLVFNQYLPVSGFDTPPFYGKPLERVGRSTGRSLGMVTAVGVDESIITLGVTLHGQAEVSGTSAIKGGDSSSPVFSKEIESGDRAKIAGLLWGIDATGKTYAFSPIAQIMKDLGPLNP